MVSNFIMQALQSKPITIYGDGLQTRSFCYVDDLVELMIRFMRNDREFCGPLNMGNPEGFTILELAQQVIELTKSSSSVLLTPLPQDDPKQRYPIIATAEERYRWKPTTPLHHGLEFTITHFDGLLRSEEL